MTSLPPPSSSTNGHAATNHLNGTSHSDGVQSIHSYDGAESAPSTSTYPINGYAQQAFQNHNEEVVNHLYHAGFQSGLYADTILHVFNQTYRLHAIILSRSPYLAHLMSTIPPVNGPRTIFLNLEQETEVTAEGIAIVLGYLYSSISVQLIAPHNARAVLAASCLLGGVDALCAYAYEACRRSITVDSIGDWLKFLETLPTAGDGSRTPELPPPSLFGIYARRLRDDIFHFLVVLLPELLGIQTATDDDGRKQLLKTYSVVPFDMFKAAIESPTLQIGTDQARFKFAKDAIELRKQGIARGSGAEETVVLAFGSSFGGSAVHVTRKMRKRQLWKVNS